MNAYESELGFNSITGAVSAPSVSARSYNEEVIAGAFRILRRHSWGLLTALVLGLVIASAYLLFSRKEYTADALIRFDFESERSDTTSKVMLDPVIVVESEARIVRSRGVAERVVAAEGLDKNPEFSSRRGILGRALALMHDAAHITDFLTGRSTDRDETARAAVDDRFANAIAALMARVSVENDNKAYLITIRFRSSSAKSAANIANAIAEQYILMRERDGLTEAKARAQAEMLRISQRFGERHPAFQAAQTRRNQIESQIEALSATKERIRSASLGPFVANVVAPALPPLSPSAPKPAVVYGLTLLVTIGLGVILIFMLDRRNAGLATEAAVQQELGAKCFGMIPTSKNLTAACSRTIVIEAVRAVGVAAALDLRASGCTVVLVASSVPDEDKTLFATTLAALLAECGRRVLLIETVSHLGRYISRAPPQKDILPIDQFGAHTAPYHTATLDDRNLMVWGDGFEEFLASARKSHDFILVKAPPALLLPDATRIGRLSDVVLLLARWRKTPVAAVANAMRRMREAGVRVSGVVLTGVDLKQSRSGPAGSQDFYLSKYRRFYASLSS